MNIKMFDDEFLLILVLLLLLIIPWVVIEKEFSALESLREEMVFERGLRRIEEVSPLEEIILLLRVEIQRIREDLKEYQEELKKSLGR
jgi:hypothetical protein